MRRVKAGRLDSIAPGTMIRVEIGNQGYLLANVNGVIYATDELCTHEDASLVNGALKDACVSCPLHGSRFDLRTGEPLEEPAENALQTYVVSIDDGEIFIEIP